MRSARKRKSVKTGKGFLNSVINSLPFEVHVPGYQFCGPGTKLKKRLARGDKGINPLDSACRTHDIAYENSNNLDIRHKADKLLEEQAWERVKAGDSSQKEKLTAYAIVNAMKAKRKIGMGFKRNNKKQLLLAKKKNNNKKMKNGKRIILVPNQLGGALPLTTIFAGLSALGSLASGASSIYNTVKNRKKKGSGLYLNNPTGKGLYLNTKGHGIVKKKKREKTNTVT